MISHPSARESGAIRQKTGSPSLAERALTSIGCDPGFVSDLFGDLREEYAERSTEQGRHAAVAWCLREIFRSVPHILWNAIRNGTPAATARLSAYALAVIGTMAVVGFLWVTRNGPPARLVAATYSEGIIVNNTGPVHLSVGVVDAKGHRLNRTDVRYHLAAGSAMLVSQNGVVKCAQRGDVVVRASLARITRDFVVHCLPIAKIQSAYWGNFVVGGSPRPLMVDAIGVDGAPVTRIAARIRIEDSTVATLNGSEMRPLRHGFTRVDVDVGDISTGMMVTVFDRVATLDDIRPDQRWVVAPVHLTPGQSITWGLPKGDFFLAFGTDSSELPTPRGFGYSRIRSSKLVMRVAGPIMCMPDLEAGALNTHCLARGSGATLTLTNRVRKTQSDVVGLLALELSQQQR